MALNINLRNAYYFHVITYLKEINIKKKKNKEKKPKIIKFHLIFLKTENNLFTLVITI